MTSIEFAKTHRCDADWVLIMSGRNISPLTPGQSGAVSGLPATVVSHYSNGMYDIRLPGGLTCVSGSDFIPA